MTEGQTRMLIDQLRSRKGDIRERAINELVGMCDIATESLVAASCSASERVRKGVKEVFARIDRIKKTELQKNAIGNLSINDPMAEDALIHSLSGVEPEIKSFAIDALGKIRSIKAIKPLIQILGNQNVSDDIRREVIEALGQISDKNAEDQLISVLKEEKLQCAAVNALGLIKSTKAVTYFIRLLDNNSLDINTSTM